MATRIQLRRDTLLNWSTVNPILAEGEIGIETDTDKLKIGNGIDAWNILNYYEPALDKHSELTLDDGTNPHGTTKSDVGLGNVDNTSDIDKPISNSTQTALTSKQNSLGFTPENVSNKENTTLDASSTKYPTNRLVKEVTDLKLDKVSTSGVERAYIINADGSQSTKATSDFKDVLEFANFASFPVTGETGKIYLALDTNKTYRWSGSAYVQIGGMEIYIKNISVSGGYTVDFNADTHRLTLTGNTTFTEINLPPVGFSKTITLHINGNFGIVFPASWTQYISGTYKGTAPLNTIVIETIGTERKVQISQPD